MVGVLTGHPAQVQGDASVTGETREELVAQLGVEAADLLGRYGHVPEQLTTTGDVDGREDERLVHGNAGVREARDAAPVAQRLRDGPPHDDAHVLHGVVIIHPGVALRADREVHERVAAEGIQHVVEESDSRLDVHLPRPIEVERDHDVGLARLSRDRRTPVHRDPPLRISASAERTASFSWGVPTVMRRQPSSPGVAEKSRTSMERSSRS